MSTPLEPADHLRSRGRSVERARPLHRALAGSVRAIGRVGAASTEVRTAPRLVLAWARSSTRRPDIVGRAASLLLVEDDADVRAIMFVMLRNAGFAVDSVSCCAEAESCLDDKDYDALVLDAMLPDGSGVDLAKRSWARGVKALVVTGSPAAMEALEKLRLPYLSKPFKSAQIVGEVERLLGDEEHW